MERGSQGGQGATWQGKTTGQLTHQIYLELIVTFESVCILVNRPELPGDADHFLYGHPLRLQ